MPDENTLFKDLQITQPIGILLKITGNSDLKGLTLRSETNLKRVINEVDQINEPMNESYEDTDFCIQEIEMYHLTTFL